MSAENEVRQASNKFYAALNSMANGDSRSMADIWPQNESVTAMHPIGGREMGWNAVRSSFAKVAEIASEGKIEIKDQLIRVFGDVAYEVGVEHAQFNLAGQKVAGDIRVTNIYHQEAGAWKIVHHHTDVAQPMVDVLSRLAPSGK